MPCHAIICTLAKLKTCVKRVGALSIADSKSRIACAPLARHGQRHALPDARSITRRPPLRRAACRQTRTLRLASLEPGRGLVCVANNMRARSHTIRDHSNTHTHTHTNTRKPWHLRDPMGASSFVVTRTLLAAGRAGQGSPACTALTLTLATRTKVDGVEHTAQSKDPEPKASLDARTWPAMLLKPQPRLQRRRPRGALALLPTHCSGLCSNPFLPRRRGGAPRTWHRWPARCGPRAGSVPQS